MPLVKSYRRKVPESEPPQEIRIVVQPLPLPEKPPQRATRTARIKRALEIPAHLKRRKKKVSPPEKEVTDFANAADALASEIEAMDREV